MKPNHLMPATVIAAAMLLPAHAAGQTAPTSRLDSLRAQFALPAISLATIATNATAPPSGSLGSPTAFGAAWGDAFVGAGYQQRVRFRNLGDGAVSGGAGFGNPRRNIGVEITATSYSTLRQGLATNGSASIKVHRVINPHLGIAAGFENAVPWGDTDGGSSLYAVASRLIPVRQDPSKIFGGIGISVGVGNARFRSERDIYANRDGINVFGNFSVRISDAVTGVADWTGQDLNAGAAVRLPGPLPLSLSLGFADLTHNAGDGARFIAGAGWAFRFR